jgi:hypothetical protein
MYTILHEFNTDYGYVFLKLVEEIVETDDPEREIVVKKQKPSKKVVKTAKKVKKGKK